jgi:hypothetical protein
MDMDHTFTNNQEAVEVAGTSRAQVSFFHPRSSDIRKLIVNHFRLLKMRNSCLTIFEI